ncbi:MAG: rRNA maturation RNase YbeY [Rectinemataceae bacterium]
MNSVDISFEGVPEAGWTGRAKDFALAAMDIMQKDRWDASILVCDDATIRFLNLRYRERDEPTDVLSFEQGGEYPDGDGVMRTLAGDLAISMQALGRNAADFGVSRDEEFKRLIVHGLLHLSGQDHEDNDPERPMLALQETMLGKLSGLARILE